MSDSQQVTELSSEQRVRAAWPGAIMPMNYVWSSNDGRTAHCLGKGWDESVNHHTVQAYEALHRPKAVAQKGTDEDNADVRMVRLLGRGVLGSQESNLVPLAIADDRNQNPAYGAWREEFEHLGDLVAHREGGEEPTLIGMSESYVESNFQECEKCGGSGLEPYPEAKPVAPASGFEAAWKQRLKTHQITYQGHGETAIAVAKGNFVAGWNAALSTHPPAPVDAWIGVKKQPPEFLSAEQVLSEVDKMCDGRTPNLAPYMREHYEKNLYMPHSVLNDLNIEPVSMWKRKERKI